MRIQKLPINPVVMRWARMSMRMTLADVADETGVSRETLSGWEERGKELPSLTELELVSKCYRRPLSFFFRPHPPDDLKLPTDRRLLLESVGEFSAEIILAVRRAHRLSKMAGHLLDEMSDNNAHVISNYQMHAPPDKVAAIERQKLGITWGTQCKWQTGKAFDNWRSALERLYRTLVFRFTFPMHEARGFALPGEKPTVIVINRKENIFARNYTLFHEFAHLLLKEDGICLTDEFRKGSGRDYQLEVWCDRFAAAFLLPRAEFEKEPMLSNIADGDTHLLHIMSKKAQVSGYAILLRMRDIALLDNQRCFELYQEYEKYMAGQKLSHGRQKVWASRIIAERGRLLPQLLLAGKSRGVINYSQLQDYMGANLKHLENLKVLLGYR